MGKEIERKFLVAGDFYPYITDKKKIIQGYLCTNPSKTVRIRILNETAFITIKGETIGMVRYEWEKEISLQEGKELLALCGNDVITKTRYIVPTSNNLYFEIDVFHDKFEGLVIAEIEIPNEDTDFERPSWLGEEVTNNVAYYNSNMIGSKSINIQDK